jgi:hypothetical protein
MNSNTRAAYAPECHGVYACRLYSAQECAAVLAKARALNSWHEAEITVEDDQGAPASITDASTRKARLMDGIAGGPLLDEFEARVRREVLPHIRDTWGIELNELAGTQLVQYQSGGHYDTHQDGGGSYANRYFTVVCYLNSDFEGGCTSFPTIPHVVRPETGKVAVFPSTYYHCAEPVTRGEKSVLVTWVCGPVPVKWI